MARRILIVEDSALVRDQMRLFLETHGYRVIVAENGREGLRKTVDEKPDLIICDVHMPEMNGLEMLAEVRAKGIDVPAFVLTTEASKDMVAEGRKVGATAWMVKPFKPDAMLKGLKRVLG